MVISRARWRNILRNNGLALTLAGLFALVFALGQIPTGHRVYNATRKEHHQPAVGLRAYLCSAPFWEITTENWESEFLQMFVYIYITTFLFQKGSAESNDPDAEPEKVVPAVDSPWPVRKGGIWLSVYQHSLSLAFGILFMISVTIHWLSSHAMENEKRQWLNQVPVSKFEHIMSAQFWFESFQNWQSEFLSIFLMVVLSVYLREKNSPESKPVAAAHDKTGE